MRRTAYDRPHFTIIHYRSHIGVVWKGHSAGALANDTKAMADMIAMILEAAGATAEVIRGSE